MPILAQGPSASHNLAAHLWASADRHPERSALETLDADGTLLRRWTYGQLRGAVARACGAFRALGLEPQSRVLLRLGNTSAFPIAFLGAASAGLVPVPSSSQLTTPEVDQLLRLTRAQAIVADGTTSLASLKALAETAVLMLDAAALDTGPFADPLAVHADDPGYLIFTSGTSGRPKGVVHAHRAIGARAPMDAGWTGLGVDDRLLHAGAFNWTYTLGTGLLDPWRRGACALIVEADRPSSIWPAVIKASRATIFAAVPSVHRQMLRDGRPVLDDFATLRHALSAGETLLPSLLADFHDQTGKPVFEAFGMSEISTYVSSGPDIAVRPGSPGRAQAGRIVAAINAHGSPCEPGEIGTLAVHRSDPGLFLHYLDDPEATKAAFSGEWFMTGDLCAIDGEGYVWPKGRADDLMNAFGYRVAPQEVEMALTGYEGISELAVTSVSEREGVDIITAFVVPDATETFDAQGFLAHAQTVLARYKCPRRIEIVPRLPRSANGKILRKLLMPESRS